MLYADLGDPTLGPKLAALEPVPGFCICVDIAGSTTLKSQGVPAWVGATLEAFACARGCLYGKFPPIKSLGDALMFFIPQSEMRGESAASLLAACCDMAADPRVQVATRIAGVLCAEAYPVTFIQGRPDYHGADIDLTFRLLGLAGPREVVVDDRFYQAAMRSAAPGAVRAYCPAPEAFHGPWPVAVRGLHAMHRIYKYVALGSENPGT